jgi:RNA ligase (TIGR02306 family)
MSVAVLDEVVERKSSTHKVEVVEVNLEPIPGADKVGLARVFGYTAVSQKDQWADGKLGAFIPPDSLVDVSRPEFAFLASAAKSDGKARIKAKRLRGVLSFGLLVPAPAGSKVGDDVAEQLGVTHYDPAVAGATGKQKSGLFAPGDAASAPAVPTVKYDLEAGRRYAQRVFEPGEPVVIAEKLHGQSAKYVFHDGKMHCSSRTVWKKEYPSYEHVTVESLLATGKVTEERALQIVADLRDKPKPRNSWWYALEQTPTLRAFCEANPGYVVYGEVVGGSIQDLGYGYPKGQVGFFGFDIMKDGRFLDFEEAYGMATAYGIPWVPIVKNGVPFDFDECCALAEGKTLVPGANHVREGVVVSALAERVDPRAGRSKVKFVGCDYYSRE